MTPTEGESEQSPVQAESLEPLGQPPPETRPQTLEPQAALEPQTLAERVRTVRGAWKWSQEEMAEMLRVDQASISFWERGKIKPSGSALVALAALFRTTLDALEKGEGFVEPSPPARGTGPKGLRALPRAVCLPVVEPGGVTVIDLASGGLVAQPTTETVKVVDQCAKDGRKVWIVVE